MIYAKGCGLFQEHPDKLFVQFLIWLIPHRKIEPCLFINDALVVCKGIEAVFSVIRSHAALSEAAESHFAGGKMDDRIVDTSAAETASRHHFSGSRTVACKDIESKGMRHGINIPYRLVQRIKGKDRHNRPEDLFLHHGVSKGHVIKDSRFDP